MKFIIIVLLSFGSNLLVGQNDLVKITTHNKTQTSNSSSILSLEEIEGLEDLGSLSSLAGLASLESLSQLESMEEIEEAMEGIEGAMKGLKGLEGLKGLQGLKALDAISVNNGYYQSGNSGINVGDNYHRGGEKKEHKIAMSSGQLILEGLEQVKITGYSGSEIIISRSIEDDDEHDERAKGLKVVNSAGLDDNTGLGINAVKEGTSLSITQVSKSCCDDDLEIKVPFGISLDISNSAVGSGDINISNVKDEIVISTTYGDIMLDDVSGPMAIKAVYGSIEAVMTGIPTDGSISLYSVYGLLDFTIPQNTKSDIEISTPYGEILTNVDIDVSNSSGMKRLSSKKMRGTINGGGLDITLKSGYKNVYLRNK